MKAQDRTEAEAQPGCGSGSPDACTYVIWNSLWFQNYQWIKNAMWNSYKLQWENHSGHVLEQGQSLAAENDVGLGRQVIMQNQRTLEFPS